VTIAHRGDRVICDLYYARVIAPFRFLLFTSRGHSAPCVVKRSSCQNDTSAMIKSPREPPRSLRVSINWQIARARDSFQKSERLLGDPSWSLKNTDMASSSSLRNCCINLRCRRTTNAFSAARAILQAEGSACSFPYACKILLQQVVDSIVRYSHFASSQRRKKRDGGPSFSSLSRDFGNSIPLSENLHFPRIPAARETRALSGRIFPLSFRRWRNDR